MGKREMPTLDEVEGSLKPMLEFDRQFGQTRALTRHVLDLIEFYYTAGWNDAVVEQGEP